MVRPKNLKFPDAPAAAGHGRRSWDKSRKKWKGQIRAKGKVKYLGSYSDEGAAGRAYDAAVCKYYPGEKLKLWKELQLHLCRRRGGQRRRRRHKVRVRRLEPRRRCRRERRGGGARFLRRGGGGGAPAPPPPLEDPDRRPQSAGGQQGVLPRVSLRQGCEGGFRGGAEGRAPAWPPLRVVVPSRMALTTPTKRWRSPLARQTHTRTKYTTRHREHLRSHSLSCLPPHQLCASAATAQRGGAIKMERDASAHSPCVRPTQCCSPGSAAEKIH